MSDSADGSRGRPSPPTCTLLKISAGARTIGQAPPKQDASVRLAMLIFRLRCATQFSRLPMVGTCPIIGVPVEGGVEDDVHIPCFVVACYAVSCVVYITLFVRFAGTFR
jgi:hypothetical protein